jgi:rhomboid family GlyGly-CTERM serine protease
MLMWDRTPIADGQIWRSMTGHLVHLSTWHCLSNLLGLLLICEYLWDELGLTEVCALWLGTAAVTSLLLWWLAPEIQWYAGLSGVLHGLWAGCALAWFCRTREPRAVFALLLLAFKLVLPPLTVSALPVVTVAHTYGALCGLIWAVLRACQRRFELFG